MLPVFAVMKLKLTRHRGYDAGLVHPGSSQQMSPASRAWGQDTAAAKTLAPARRNHTSVNIEPHITPYEQALQGQQQLQPRCDM